MGLCLLALAATTLAIQAVEAGFLMHDFPLTLERGQRREVLGPLYFQQDQEGTRSWALSPLMSFQGDDSTETRRWDFLYPLFTSYRIGEEGRWQFFQVLNGVRGQNQAGSQPRRFSVFPFYLQQRSSDSNLNYTSVFPLYGTVKNRLRRDEMHFVAFPLYLESRKADVRTRNYLFPLYHVRAGDRLKGWQIWPLYGRQRKETTQRTNTFDEVVTVGGHETSFALWPLVLDQRTGIGTTNESRFQAYLPFYARQRSAARDSTSIVWPLFTLTEDREKRYREWDFPWPFLVLAQGEGKTTRRIWPLYSRAYNTNLQSGFFLWPVYKYNAFRTPSLERSRHRILFFLYSRKNERQLETGQQRHRTDLWPLFHAQQDFEGHRRVQLLSVLDSIWPENSSVRRVYSPLWSLWRYEKNARTGVESRSVLWNLGRWESGPGRGRGSFLFGLVQYQRDVSGRHWRWFYLPARGRNHRVPSPDARAGT